MIKLSFKYIHTEVMCCILGPERCVYIYVQGYQKCIHILRDIIYVLCAYVVLAPSVYIHIYTHIFEIKYHKDTYVLFRKYTPTLTDTVGTADTADTAYRE